MIAGCSNVLDPSFLFPLQNDVTSLGSQFKHSSMHPHFGKILTHMVLNCNAILASSAYRYNIIRQAWIFHFSSSYNPTTEGRVFISAVRSKIEISSPQDFSHEMHVGFNQESGEFIVSCPLVNQFSGILDPLPRPPLRR